MRLRQVGMRDLLAGLLVMAVGAFVVWNAMGYRLGTINRMGPGFFPVMLGWLTVGLGGLLAANALFGAALGRAYAAWARPPVGGSAGLRDETPAVPRDGGSAGAGLPRVAWRALLAVLAAILCFAVLLRLVGLLPAIAATVIVAALGDREARVHEIALVALGAVIGAWAIFHVGLGLSVPILRWPF